MIGLGGFAVASAIGGTAQSFGVLVAARALQGAFGALLAPAALSLLTTTFTNPVERGRAFGIYGAIAGAGAAIGLLLGGVLTEFLDWRWTMYVNLVIAVPAMLAAFSLLVNERPAVRPKLDLPGTVAATTGLFALVYGFSSAETNGWGSPLTVGSIAAGVALLVAFVVLQARGRHPLLPLRVVLDRDRGGSYLAVGHRRCGHVRRLPVPHLLPAADPGLQPAAVRARVPADGRRDHAQRDDRQRDGAAADRPQAARAGRDGAGGRRDDAADGRRRRHELRDARAARARHRRARLRPDLRPVDGDGDRRRGRSEDAGVASAMVNTTQQIGGSLGTALLSTLAASAATTFAAGKAATPDVMASAAVHGYTTAFWWSAGIFAAGALICGLLLRPGAQELDPSAQPVLAH